MIHVLDKAYDNPLEAEEQATVPFVGGIRQHGYQCGQIWGASLAGGARMLQKLTPGSEASTRALMASQGLVDDFREISGEVNCHEITSIDKDSSNLDLVNYFLLKGGSIGCFRMASKYAPQAYESIEKSLETDQVRIPDSQPSCTALLAEKMDASPRHQTMVAGLAGGIGLCGEACGALGTAVWLHALETQTNNPEIDLWQDRQFGARFESLVEAFLQASDYEFECKDIVGRKFENIQDHADFLERGGCQNIIEALAAV